MSALKRTRKLHGYTQLELAQAIGVTQGAVHQWESGKSHPTFENLRKIAQVFNCKVDDLIDS